MVIAMAGLIPAFFAKGESKTAQRHLGAVFIKALTLVQHVAGTLALPFPAALKQGLKLDAADPMGVFPHSPAPSTSRTKAAEASMSTNAAMRHALVVVVVVVVLLLAILQSEIHVVSPWTNYIYATIDEEGKGDFLN